MKDGIWGFHGSPHPPSGERVKSYPVLVEIRIQEPLFPEKLKGGRREEVVRSGGLGGSDEALGR